MANPEVINPCVIDTLHEKLRYFLCDDAQSQDNIYLDCSAVRCEECSLDSTCRNITEAEQAAWMMLVLRGKA